MGEDRDVSRGQVGGVAYLVVCPPLRWCWVLGHAFALRGSWIFWSLCIVCPESAITAHADSYFSSHIVSLYFIVGGEVVQV